ncbi:MAG: type III toxin-antitoxin system ToxN/AbiQ family toxin [Fusobacterium sp.]|uniref:type III toxin-antitoxin system ToxN/AbiQ family toxin n=1 Tax=Fusobacterium sp. TaxID=68766 RepID=UPI0026DD4069|nr:type III toxin-antitoxin system ToxN/AbiQ family toxin [Fusobacterium sp.]MDO4689821.1 type III toxin-antitoxin system ToxN/AbiQ family toxin [Fusobacterium sp.]
MNKRFKFYHINEEYIRYLRMFDSNVTDNSKENKKEKRPYIGILIEVENFKYLAPLSSKKSKFYSMKNNIDFIKINNGKEGAINLNNMLPVNSIFVSEYNPILEKDLDYKKLVEKQLSWCNEEVNKLKILKHAGKLYRLLQTNRLPKNIEKRCCNFKLLEEKSLEYLEIQKLEKKFEVNKENYELIINNLKEIRESVKDKNYNCLTGNQILVKSHSEDRKWIPASMVKEHKIRIKANERAIKGILTNIEEGKFYVKPIEYYNVSQLYITKELEQKFVPMKEKTIKIEKDKGIER